MAVTFVTVAVLLAVVFVVLTVETRDRVRTAEMERLQVSEGIFTTLEERREHDRLAVVATLAENPTLKAALDTYTTESEFSGLEPEQEAALRSTITREMEKLAATTSSDVIAIIDTSGRVFTTAGKPDDRWPAGQPIALGDGSNATYQGVVALSGRAFRVSAAALRLGDHNVGSLVLGTNLDQDYARELSVLSHADVVITVNQQVIARTVSEDVSSALVANDEWDTARVLNGEEYGVRVLLNAGNARVFMLTSIDNATSAATHDAIVALGSVAAGSVLLAALSSLWLAKTLTDPINRVASAISSSTAAQSYRRYLEPTGTSREMDALTHAFNELMNGVTTAEAETRAAYLGAIKALAAALDARDPYTAGHSERVSSVSVMIAEQMKLSATEVEVIRLGALLHDIGKIGVSDDVLRKPGPLTHDEFEQIKRHPGLGARILRQVPFLAPYLPIVELHHEQPDGEGYPFGLRGDEIPLAAHIVHVADTYDAMTSARAYRPARPATVALDELQRYSGTQFDPACVEALMAALPASSLTEIPKLEELFRRGA